MVESKPKFFVSDRRVAFLIGVTGDPYLHSVPSEIEFVRQYLEDMHFEEIVVLQDK